jgi:protein-S-isoprenylcysteine O-methyltransferase Ste14
MAMNDRMRRIPPPVWLVAAAGVQWLVSAHTRRVTRRSIVAATIIAGGGGALAISAARTLQRHGTTLTPEHPEEATVLVADGPFVFTRNPIYLAFAAALVAHAILRRSPLALLPVAAFVAVIDRVQIPAEEHALLDRFGVRYEYYRRTVPRWIGVRAR